MFLKPSLCLSSILVIALIANQYQSRVPSRSDPIDFTIGGVGIDSTLEELRELLPTAVAGHSPNAIPMLNDHLVVINNGANQVPIAYFRFLNNAVSSIEVHYSVASAMEISKEKPMIDQFVSRFGKYDKTWRNDDLDGGVNIYMWKSETRGVSFSVFDDGSAKLYITGIIPGHPPLYPPATPKTTILGIDPLQDLKSPR